MNTIIKRSLLITLVLVMILSIASCGTLKKSQETSASDTTTNQDETDNLYDANGYLLDNIPNDLKFTGKVLTILCNNQQKKQVYYHEISGDLVNDALYSRESKLKSRLDIETNWIFKDGSWDGKNSHLEFLSLLENDITAGTGEYDLVVGYNLIPPAAAIKGFLSDLTQSSYIELDKPWWPQSYVEQASYNDKLYFLAESSSYGVLRNMMGVFFNTKLVDTFGLEDPYQLVLDGNWTAEKMFSMTQGTYSDLDGSNTKNELDQFGFASATKPYLDSLFYGMGLKTTSFDSEGVPQFTLGETKVVDYITKITSYIHNNPDIYTIDTSQYKMFREGRAVFYHTAVAIADTIKSEAGLSYGVAPMPKASIDSDYHTPLSNTHDVWCIPTTAKEFEKSSAALEIFGSEAYRQVYPAYFETALKVKYASNEKIGQVYDTMRDSLTFDFGYIYSIAFTRMPMLDVRDVVSNNTGNWASTWDSKKSVYIDELEIIITALSK